MDMKLWACSLMLLLVDSGGGAQAAFILLTTWEIVSCFSSLDATLMVISPSNTQECFKLIHWADSWSGLWFSSWVYEAFMKQGSTWCVAVVMASQAGVEIKHMSKRVLTFLNGWTVLEAGGLGGRLGWVGVFAGFDGQDHILCSWRLLLGGQQVI